MDNTSRMVALLALMRAQQNGVVAESMHNAGFRGMMNYGVIIPTIRRIASEQPRDHAFAKFLYRQQVRELRMAAVTIAQAECVTPMELDFWLSGDPNVELVEELAMRLLYRTSIIDEIIERWLFAGGQMECYAAMMTLARAERYDHCRVLQGLLRVVGNYPDDVRLARAASVVIASISARFDARQPIADFMAELSGYISPAATFLTEELSWLLEG